MKQKNFFLTFSYFIILLAFSIYSYVLVDLNLTLINHPLWTNFRNFTIQIGYFKRNLSSFIYIFFIFILFIFHFSFLKSKISGFKIALIAFSATFFSYPFLSHDFFNYLFDAKILIYYKKNPYFYTPLDFSNDPWLRFMHWVHRKYPYGIFFLFYSSIPFLFSFGKFFLSFFFSKLFYLLTFVISIFYIEKINKKAAIFLATHPLIIVEGFINTHNDLVALSLALFGIYFISKNKTLKSLLSFLCSGFVKYLSLPSIILVLNRKKFAKELSFILTVLFIIAISLKGEIQPWYFLNLFIFTPYLLQWIKNFQIFFASLLFSYYPYIRFSEWNLKSSIDLKHQIIMTGAIINLLFLCSKIALKKLKK